MPEHQHPSRNQQRRRCRRGSPSPAMPLHASRPAHGDGRRIRLLLVRLVSSPRTPHRIILGGGGIFPRRRQGSEIGERPTNIGSQEYFNGDGGYVHDRTVVMRPPHDANQWRPTHRRSHALDGRDVRIVALCGSLQAKSKNLASAFSGIVRRFGGCQATECFTCG